MAGQAGKSYCVKHTSSAVLPAPEGPNVKFEQDVKGHTQQRNGLGGIPDDVLMALVMKFLTRTSGVNKILLKS